MRLIFLGAPGTGKGTQASYLSKQYGIPQISTGDILRKAVQNDTELGRKAKTIMEKGDLVPDDIILELIKNRLSQSDCDEGYILDGFPRTIGQAESLDDMLSEKPIQAVINFVVDKEAIIERITSRRVCSVCGYPHNIISDPPKEGNICKKCGGKVIHRKDDTEDTVKNRLAVYEEKTAPLVEYYRKKGFLHNIDGNQSVENVRKSIDDVIHNIRA